MNNAPNILLVLFHSLGPLVSYIHTGTRTPPPPHTRARFMCTCTSVVEFSSQSVYGSQINKYGLLQICQWYENECHIKTQVRADLFEPNLSESRHCSMHDELAIHFPSQLFNICEVVISMYTLNNVPVTIFSSLRNHSKLFLYKYIFQSKLPLILIRQKVSTTSLLLVNRK